MTYILLLWIASSPASGPIPAEKLTYRNGPIQVIGRYKEFFAGRFLLYGTKIKFISKDPAHREVLLSLNSQKDNVLLKGRFKNKNEVVVEEIKKAKRDAQLFLEKSKKIPECPEKPDRLIALGRKAIERASKFKDAALKSAGLSILRKGMLAKRNKIDPGDYRRRLAWLKELVRTMPGKDWAFQEAKKLAEENPQWERATEFFRSLGAVKWRNKWLRREEFLRKQGLINIENKWLTRSEFEFRKACAKLRAMYQEERILRFETDAHYAKQAERERLQTGMTRREAVTAWGFPEEVMRTEENGVVMDQWRYGDESVYLLNGKVAILPVGGDNQ